MKHLTTLLTALVAFAAAAQQMPYNPDANGDDFVGVDDVLGVLGVYDTALMQPDLQCDYEGTELEQFIIGTLDGSLVLDSVYIEYALTDSSEAFTIGCPDASVLETVLVRSYIITPAYFSNVPQDNEWELALETTYLGYNRGITIGYRFDYGTYWVKLFDEEAGSMTSFGSDSYWEGGEQQLPFPESWHLDSDGIQVSWGSWASSAQNLRVVPFWHEAE